MLSWGTAYFPLVTLNDVVCATVLSIWLSLEIISDYAVVAMMIERCVVVFFPLKAKAFVNPRFSIILLCICIVPFWLALVPVSLFILGVQAGSMWSPSGLFCGWYENRPAFPYFLWAYQLIIFTFHVVVGSVLVVILCVVIVVRQHNRHRLLSRDRGGSGLSGREYNSIVIMLLVSSINIIMYIPGLVSMLISYLTDSTTWSESAQDMLANISRLILGVPCIAHSFSLFVYICRIPTFRSEMGNVFSFCLAK